MPKTDTAQITPEMQAIVAVDQKRENITNVIEMQKTKLLQNACSYVRAMPEAKKEALLYRTVTALLDEKLAECFATPQGKLSIFRIIEDTMATGLELGKHAYAVPQKTKVGNQYLVVARYDIKRQGYHALLCGTDKPIFKNLRWGTVYKNDICTVDVNSGEVSHKANISPDRGPVIGVWVQAIIVTAKDSTTKEAQFYPVTYILNIRDKHSESYKAYKAGKISITPWETDPVPMYEKTAIKAFCRPWADVQDALAYAIYDEGGESVPESDAEMDREQAAETIIDAALSDPDPIEPEADIVKDGSSDKADGDIENASANSEELF